MGRISKKWWYGYLSIIESSCGGNSTSLCTCMLYFPCCIFLYFNCCNKMTSLYVTASSAIYLKDFWSYSKEDSFLWVKQLGLIYYLLICLCLFREYMSVRKFIFQMLFLILLIISSLYVVLGFFWHIPLLLNSLY